MKSLLKHFLRKIGFAVHSVPDPLILRPDAELRFNFEHVVLRQFCLSPDFFFVQVGAFDGSTVDPIYRMVRRFGWRGLLVEPEQTAFEKLRTTYAGVAHLQFADVAIGDFDGEAAFHVVNPAISDLPSKAPLISSLDRSSVVANLGFDGKDVLLERKVRVCRLSTLLRERGIDRVDLLQIDAEGYDFKIIKSLDAGPVKPTIINFEHALLSKVDKEACWEFLIARGYRLFIHEPDTTACLVDDDL